MKEVLIASFIISIAIIYNGYIERKIHSDKIARCIEIYNTDIKGNIRYKADDNNYEALWLLCEK